ncbi:MAG: hypothetical protein AB4038_14295 [Prochloraceae cyanobacterium]|nr:hypothetical protein [Xenococcaceae cyanobacterium MO_167.B52]
MAIAIMRETTPAAMPPCFDRWCKKFDDLLRTKAQKAVRPCCPGCWLNENHHVFTSYKASLGLIFV